MAHKQPINWDDVLGWTGHRPLFHKHGLVDGLTMASALNEVERQAWLLLERDGYTALGDWLLRRDEGNTVLRVPDEVGIPLWKSSFRALDANVPRHFYVDFYVPPDRLLELECLDLRRNLGPRFWVQRESVKLTRQQVERASDGFPCITIMSLPLTAAPECESDPDKVYLVGMEFGLNPWWREETLAAARRLSRLSQDALAAEMARAGWTIPGGRESHRFWRVVGRERQMHVRRLVSSDPWKEGIVQQTVQMPELGAIPFYHRDQLLELHKAVVEGQVKLSLLGRLADSDFKTGKIGKLRNRFGYPRVETRGRWRRDPAMIAEARRLVEQEGLSKYAAAKRLRMKRPTLYDYLRCTEEARP